MELKSDAGRAQAVYARSLAWGTRIGFTLLVVSCAAYVAGLARAHVPIEDLPRHWSKPASDLLEATGTAAGWGWFALVPGLDMLVLAAIAFLATCSILSLSLALKAFWEEGSRIPAVLCALEVLVILSAASGWFVAGH